MMKIMKFSFFSEIRSFKNYLLINPLIYIIRKNEHILKKKIELISILFLFLKFL
jgi:hypothetical protein